MSLHKEISFKNEICDTLAVQGWLYAEHPQGVRRGCNGTEVPTTTQGDAKQYDRTRALFPADLIAWVQRPSPRRERR